MLDSLFAFLACALAGAMGAWPFAHPNNVFPLAPAGVDAGLLATFALALSASHALVALLAAARLARGATKPRESKENGERGESEGKKGEGKLASSAFLGALGLASLLAPFALAADAVLLPLAKNAGAPVLVLLFGVLVAQNPKRERVKSALYALACAALGFIALSNPSSASQRLFPLLAGLYGVPALLEMNSQGDNDARDAITQNSKQARSAVGFAVGVLAASLSVLLPAVTPQLAWGVALAAASVPSESALAFGASFVGARLAFDTALAVTGGPARSAAASLAKQAWTPTSAPGLAALTQSALPNALPFALFILLASAGVAARYGPKLVEPLARMAQRAPKPVLLAVLALLVVLTNGLGDVPVLVASSALGVAGMGIPKRTGLAAVALAAPAIAAWTRV